MTHPAGPARDLERTAVSRPDRAYNAKGFDVHYMNGRPAANGDKVVLLPGYPKDAAGKSLATPVVGILYDAVAGNDHCNGKIAPISPIDPCPNLKECLHLDDARAMIDAALKAAAEQPKE